MKSRLPLAVLVGSVGATAFISFGAPAANAGTTLRSSVPAVVGAAEPAPPKIDWAKVDWKKLLPELQKLQTNPNLKADVEKFLAAPSVKRLSDYLAQQKPVIDHLQDLVKQISAIMAKIPNDPKVVGAYKVLIQNPKILKLLGDVKDPAKVDWKAQIPKLQELSKDPSLKAEGDQAIKAITDSGPVGELKGWALFHSLELLGLKGQVEGVGHEVQARAAEISKDPDANAALQALSTDPAIQMLIKDAQAAGKPA